MQAEELDQLVKEAGVTIRLSPDVEERRFSEFEALVGFVEAELVFWQSIPSSRVSAVFDQVLGRLRSLRQDHSLQRQSARLILAEALAHLAPPNRVLFSGTRAGAVLKDLRDYSPEAYRGGEDYLLAMVHLDSARVDLLKPEYFKGWFSASLRYDPGIASDALAAEATQSRDLRDKLTAEVEAKSQELGELRRRYDEALATAAQDQQEAQKALSGIMTTAKQDIKLWLDGAEEQRRQLERLYQEQLRLKAPAELWSALEKGYVASGRWSIAGLCLVILIALGIASWIVYSPPEEWLTSSLTTAGSIKSSIITTVGISLVLYLAHFCARIATSSYHLARDARERLQLSHMFLALVKEQTMDHREREIVFSSLFSRSDTGLLKHDGSPVLPNSVTSILDSVRGRT